MKGTLDHGPIVAPPVAGDWAIRYTVWWVGERLAPGASLPDWFAPYWVEGHLKWDGVNYGGLAFAPGPIIVLASKSGLISDTSLVHEIFHILLWQTTGSIDRDHVSEWWTHLREINYEIAAYGW